MKIALVRNEKAVVVNVSGRMDTSTAPQFVKVCGELIETGEVRLLVDLRQLEYISSAGLSALLAVGQKLKSKGGELVLCGATGMVKQVFDVSCFSAIFTLRETPDLPA